MTLELQVHFNATTRQLDATQTLIELRRMLRIVELLEESVVHHDLEADARTVWRFSRLGLGSVDATFAPATDANLERVSPAALRLVTGFRAAQNVVGVPDGWPVSAARSAATVARSLGVSRQEGMRLTLIVDGEEVEHSDVTRQAARNLNKALKVSHESIGAVVGELGSVVLHGRRQAGIWPDGGGSRVTVTFEDDKWDDVRGALGRRVQISGRLKRNVSGQLLSVKLRRIEALGSLEDTPPLRELRGAGRGMTGDLTAVEYLRRMRDPS